MSAAGRCSKAVPQGMPYSPTLQSALVRLDDFFLSGPRQPVDKIRVRDSPNRSEALQSIFKKLAIRFPPRSVLVTGSKGKGTVSTLIAAGMRSPPLALGPVATFMSPHLHRYTERLRVDNAVVDDDGMGDALHATLDLVDALPKHTLIWFDVVFTSAMHALSKLGVGRAVIEGGIGSRTDATGVTLSPQVSVITNVYAEHLDVLGPTVADVAYEKAGAIKPGVRAIVGMADSHALSDVFVTEAASVDPPATVRFVPPQPEDTLFDTNLRVARAALAAIAESEGIQVPEDVAELLSEHDARSALSAAHPGRQERFVVPVGNARVNVLVDCAHVPESIAAVMNESSLRDAVVVLGTYNSKKVTTICDMVVARGSKIVTTVAARGSGENDSASLLFADAKELARICVDAGMRAEDVVAQEDVAVALDTALQFGAERDRDVVVIGALALAGAARGLLLQKAVM